MKLVDDIQHFWRFWSVRFWILAAACSAAGTAYAAFKAFAPEFVVGVPPILLTALTVSAMGFGFAGVVSRGIRQNLPPPPPPPSNDFHQGAP